MCRVGQFHKASLMDCCGKDDECGCRLSCIQRRMEELQRSMGFDSTPDEVPLHRQSRKDLPYLQMVRRDESPFTIYIGILFQVHFFEF